MIMLATRSRRQRNESEHAAEGESDEDVGSPLDPLTGNADVKT
jgi:hypothetical protein